MRLLARRSTRRLAFTTLLCLLLPVAARRAAAQGDIHAGFDEFPEFRNVSGLSGSGYGNDGKGYFSLSGPVGFSAPVGPVLGRDQVFGVVSYLSFDALPAFSDTAAHGSNRKFFATFGHTFSKTWQVAISDMAISWPAGKKFPIQVFNLQLQPPTAFNGHLVGSIGVQDMLGHGGSAGNGVPGDTRTSRSYFGVASYRIDTPRHPVWISAGLGTRRFHQGFGSVSYQVLKPMRVYLEHDGFGLNAGVLGAWNLTNASRPIEITTNLGYNDQRYFYWAVGLGF